MEIDKKIIKKLVEALEELKISLKDEIIIDDDNQVEEEIEISKAVVKSPIVGTAYLASEPGAKPFISVGKKIKKGETIMIVEAMKTMNHVPSSLDGTVKKICVEDGQPIEYDQVLIILE
jgi:acetyl-CoA carboxylase biotin carboxyl carrier protein|tara:strand:+ start:655 stop:1011 length:357 start_codon:yes stop_codon:yes gene_type:complete